MHGARTPIVMLLVVFISSTLAGCGVLFVRPVYEQYEADWDFKNSIDFEREVDTRRVGVEVGLRPGDGVEIFAVGAAEELDAEDSALEPEGWFLGAGIRSSHPWDEGLYVDWGVRGGFGSVDDDDDIFDENQDEDFEILEGDANLGIGYAFEIGEDYLLTPQGGAFYKIIRGDRDIEIDNIDDEDYDVELDSVGGYLGLRLNAVEAPGLELMVNGFAGTESFLGFAASVGIRF